MSKLLLGTLVLGIFSTSVWAGVKKVYVGSSGGGYPHYVVECTDGNRHTDLTQKSDGYWHSGVVMSNMGDRYKNLSINEVAKKLCN